MTLASLLAPEQIVPRMRSKERWSAIVELVDVLVSIQRIQEPDRDSILAALKQREETMSTGIGFGIAIPHATSDRVQNVVVAFGRSPEGIEFESLDNQPVRLIVLFISPKNEYQQHLRTLAAIAKQLNDLGVRQQLSTAEGAADILRVFEAKTGVKAGA